MQVNRMAILLPLRLQVKQEAVRITQKDQRTKGFSSRAVAFHVLLRLQELLQSSAALYFLFMGINKGGSSLWFTSVW